MANPEEAGGRERRQHDRFVLRKRVEPSTATKTYDGILRDISVGGAAIKIRAPLYQTRIVSLDINDLGAYKGEILRQIDDEHVAVQFSPSEEQSLELASKLVGIYYGATEEENDNPSDVEKFDLTP